MAYANLISISRCCCEPPCCFCAEPGLHWRQNQVPPMRIVIEPGHPYCYDASSTCANEWPPVNPTPLYAGERLLQPVYPLGFDPQALCGGWGQIWRDEFLLCEVQSGFLYQSWGVIEVECLGGSQPGFAVRVGLRDDLPIFFQCLHSTFFPLRDPEERFYCITEQSFLPYTITQVIPQAAGSCFSPGIGLFDWPVTGPVTITIGKETTHIRDVLTGRAVLDAATLRRLRL